MKNCNYWVSQAIEETLALEGEKLINYYTTKLLFYIFYIYDLPLLQIYVCHKKEIKFKK